LATAPKRVLRVSFTNLTLTVKWRRQEGEIRQGVPVMRPVSNGIGGAIAKVDLTFRPATNLPQLSQAMSPPRR